jgi:DNA-binding GntR family transcriptional regulator
MEIEREQQTLQAKIKRILREEIAQGVWQPGARIPTESELMHRFSVSRITVSQALKDMVKEGLVVRRQGRGTFVSAHQHAWVNLGGLLQRMPPATPDSAHANTRVAKEVPPADVALDRRLSPGADWGQQFFVAILAHLTGHKAAGAGRSSGPCCWSLNLPTSFKSGPHSPPSRW